MLLVHQSFHQMAALGQTSGFPKGSPQMTKYHFGRKICPEIQIILLVNMSQGRINEIGFQNSWGNIRH